MASENPTLERLDDQINWYDRNSISCQRIYKRAKVLEIVIAAFIPLGTAIKVISPIIIGALGVIITVIEGVLHLNQYQQNWLSYRTACEALRHEKYLYVAAAGPYANVQNATALLADRIESLISQENAKWVSTQLPVATDSSTPATQ